jgi:SAM-dependent methyltransferase
MGYLLDSGPNPLFKKTLLDAASVRCIVLGAGQETGLIEKFCGNVIGINILRDELPKRKGHNVDLIMCDAQVLPIRESSVDFVVCKSTLHHLNNINNSITEINRVSSKGSYIFFYEPGLLNLIALFGRKIFPTVIHDPSEKPFNPVNLRKVLSKNFEVVKEADFFLFVHIIPILGKTFKIFRNRFLIAGLCSFDSFLCKTYLRNFSWILVFTMRKKL